VFYAHPFPLPIKQTSTLQFVNNLQQVDWFLCTPLVNKTDCYTSLSITCDR